MTFKVEFGKAYVCISSVYIEPAVRESMSCITRHLSTPPILCGDFNAHNTIWGSDHCDARGHLIEDTINKYGIALLNYGWPYFWGGIPKITVWTYQCAQVILPPVWRGEQTWKPETVIIYQSLYINPNSCAIGIDDVFLLQTKRISVALAQPALTKLQQ